MNPSPHLLSSESDAFYMKIYLPEKVFSRVVLKYEKSVVKNSWTRVHQVLNTLFYCILGSPEYSGNGEA